MILLIDNYDSFTYNLSQQIATLGYNVQVVTHDAITVDEIAKLHPEKIVISPGPKSPDHSGICQDVIAAFYKTIPILGVCLGHQCIGQLFGAQVVHAPEIMHGRTSPVHHNAIGLFKGLPSPLTVARYHSLVLDAVPKNFTLTAWTDKAIIMAIKHDTYPLYGIQFHPESFMTEQGNQLMRNFLDEICNPI